MVATLGKVFDAQCNVIQSTEQITNSNWEVNQHLLSSVFKHIFYTHVLEVTHCRILKELLESLHLGKYLLQKTIHLPHMTWPNMAAFAHFMYTSLFTGRDSMAGIGFSFCVCVCVIVVQETPLVTKTTT